MDRFIFKILTCDEVAVATEKGNFVGSAVDHQDGYIHFSTAAQVRETARKHFTGRHDLVIAAIDVSQVQSDLRWEPSRGGQLFPHLYSKLDWNAVAWVRELPLDPDTGEHQFPAEVEASVGSG